MAAKAYILMKVKAGKAQDVLATLKALPEVEQAHACSVSLIFLAS